MSDSIESSSSPTFGKRIGFWLGLLSYFVIPYFLVLDPTTPLDERMAAIAALMAIWWVSDAIPLAATSLLPVVLFPLAGIMDGDKVAPIYMNYVIFLYLGGFLIALAMERWNLHRRIALRIIRVIGSDPSRLVLGFMLSTAFLSAWISNTATAIMMLAIGMAILKQTETVFGPEKTSNLSVALLLGIAYSASIGGMATLVGTPPNIALVRLFDLSFPDAAAAGYQISFARWMLLGVPLAVVLLIATWLILTRVCFRFPSDLQLDSEIVEEQYRQLGPMSREEKCVLAVFAGTALLWIFRADLEIGSIRIPGWSHLFPFGSFFDDGTVAIAMALLLFIIPVKRLSNAGEKVGAILDPAVFAKIPWHIVLLFGGGFAIAKGFQSSGLSAWVGTQFTGLEGAPVPVLVASICGILTFLTEFTSNTATTEMVLPLLASISTATEIHPLLLMIPATLSASCAFMMPVATPPNAIIFASGRVRIGQMVKAGLILNLIGIVVVTALFLLLGGPIFDIDQTALPAWAK